MMKYHVVVSERAQRDLAAISKWWADERSAEQAGRWLAGIDKRLQSLSRSPVRCQLAAEREQFPYEIREIHYGLGHQPTHRAVFRIVEDVVIVLTIRHVAQDWVRPEEVV